MSIINRVPADVLDAAERTVWTFVEAFVAVFVVTDLASSKAAGIAALAAAVAVVKSFAAKRLTGSVGYQPKHAAE